MALPRRSWRFWGYQHFKCFNFSSFFSKVPTHKASTRNTRNIKNPKTAVYFDQTLQSFSFLKKLMRYEFIIKKSCSCLHVLSKIGKSSNIFSHPCLHCFQTPTEKTAEKTVSSKWLDAGAWTAWLKCLAASAWRLSSAMADKQPLCGWFLSEKCCEALTLRIVSKSVFFGKYLMGFVYGFVKPWFDFVANLQIETVDGSGGLEQKIPVDLTGGLSRSQVDSRWVKATSGISTVFLSSLFFPFDQHLQHSRNDCRITRIKDGNSVIFTSSDPPVSVDGCSRPAQLLTVRREREISVTRSSKVFMSSAFWC